MKLPFSVNTCVADGTAFVCLLVGVLCLQLSSIPTLQASSATDWLRSNMHSDGGVYRPDDLANAEQSTVVALCHLDSQQALEQSDLENGRVFLAAASDRSTALVADLIKVKRLLGENFADVVAELLLAQNQDGGFGAYRQYDSSVLDTAVALAALTAQVGVHDQAIWQALTFLLSKQNSDGGWSDGVNHSDLIVTAKVAQALTSLYTYHAQIPSALSQAESYLLAGRTAAGGRAWFDTYQTVSALFALIPITADKNQFQTTIDWLAEQQSIDGSWHADVYQTALAAEVIALFSRPITAPDLAAVSGQISALETGLPLANVLLQVGTQSAMSDTNGDFFLSGLTPGASEITLSLAGYGTLMVTTTLSAGQNFSLGHIQLIKSSTSPYAVVSGVVKDGVSAGQPLADAVVSIPALGLSTLTNAAGEYQLTGIISGDWEVQVEKIGYASQSAQFTAVPSGQISYSPTLQSDGSTVASGLFGRIVAADSGQPLAGVLVQVVATSETISTETDSNGEYLLAQLPVGDLQISTSLSGYDSTHLLLQSLAAGAVEYSPMLYAVGTSPAAANSGAVRGYIADAATKLALVGVQVTAQWGVDTFVVYTDANGEFLIPGVTANRGGLTISHPGYRSTQIAFVLSPLEQQNLGAIALLPSAVEAIEPDLTISDLNLAALITNTQTGELSGSVSLQIENLGNRITSNPIDVLAYYDVNHNQQFDPQTDLSLGQVTTTDTIQAQNSISVNLPMSGAVPFVDAPIGFWVDSSQSIQEADETNNQAASFSVCSEQSDETETITIKEKWHWPNQKILSAPLVSRLIDTNLDGFVNEKDDPVVIIVSHTGFIDGSKGILRVLNGESGQEIWSLEGTGYYTDGPAVPAVGDIDGDGYPEIVMYRFNGGVMAISHEGALKWVSFDVPDPGHLNYGSISIADLDGDGLSEVLARNYILNHDGSLRWSIPIAVWNATSSFAADFNNDGFLEVVLGSHVYNHMGQPYWVNTTSTTVFSAIINIDSDIYPELVVIDPLKTLMQVYDHDGQLFWSVSLPGKGGGAPTVADFDGDGFPEIGAANRAYYTAVNHDGSILWQSPIVDETSSTTGSVSFDFNNDGKSEIAHADSLFFRIFDGSTGLPLVKLSNSTFTGAEYPTVADIDGDLHAEILLVSDRSPVGIRAFEGDIVPWARSRAVWNQYNYHIDNVNQDGSIPKHPVKGWLTHNTFRLNAFPENEQPGSVDLTAGYIRVLDAGISQGYRISARIGNAGVSPASAGAQVKFYAGDPASGGLLLGTITLPAIDSGHYELAELSGIFALSATTDIYVVVDPDNLIEECSEQNNQASAPFAANLLGDLAITLDHTTYTPNSLVSINASVHNLSQQTADFIIRHSIRDLNHNLVFQFADSDVLALASDDVQSWQLSWDTALTLAGTYKSVSELVDTQGGLLDSVQNLFAIQHPASASAAASLRTTTDRPQYNPSDTLYVDHLVINETESTLLQQVQIVTLLIDSSGQLIGSASSAQADLTPGSVQRTILPLPISDLLPGDYTVVGELLYQGAAQPQMSVAQIKVAQSLAVDLATNTSVDYKLIEDAQPQVCRTLIENLGGLPIASVPTRHTLINFETESRTGGTVSSIDLAPGASQTLITSFDSIPLAAGHYACALEIEQAGEWQQFAYDSFEVRPPPINIETTLFQQGQGRVLVLVDGRSASESCYAPQQFSLQVTLPENLDAASELQVWLKDSDGVLLDSETFRVDQATWPLNSSASTDNAELQVDNLQTGLLSLNLSAAALPALTGAYQIELKATPSEGAIQTYASGLFALECNRPYVMGQTLGDFMVTAVVLPASVLSTEDPHGPAEAPNLTEQQLYLESTLQGAGWSYVVVDTAAAFVTELRRGGFHLALVLSEQIKLEAQTQKELREMVFRGEGLVVAGSHDNRNQNLFDILGIKLNGKAVEADGVAILPPVVDIALASSLGYADKVLRDDLQGASEAGHYLTFDGIGLVPHTQAIAAVTHYQYGAGQAVFVGFDVLAHATAVGGQNALQTALLSSMQFVMPEPVHTTATAALPMQINLHNLGIATPGQVQISLTGATAAALPAEATMISASEFNWAFNLALEQQLELPFWIRLQELAGIGSVNADLFTGEPDSLVWHDTVSYAFDIEAPPDLNALAAELQTIAADKSAHKGYGKALTQLEAAQDALSIAQIEDALVALIAVTDQLAPIDEVQADEIRQAIDEHIRILGTQL